MTNNLKLSVTDIKTWRQSDEAIRDLIAREIWRFNECPWDFDSPPEGMAQLQRQLAINQAEGLRKVILRSAVLKARLCATTE